MSRAACCVLQPAALTAPPAQQTALAAVASSPVLTYTPLPFADTPPRSRRRPLPSRSTSVRTVYTPQREHRVIKASYDNDNGRQAQELRMASILGGPGNAADDETVRGGPKAGFFKPAAAAALCCCALSAAALIRCLHTPWLLLSQLLTHCLSLKSV